MATKAIYNDIVEILDRPISQIDINLDGYEAAREARIREALLRIADWLDELKRRLDLQMKVW